MELEKLKDMLYNAAGGPVGIQMCHEAADAIEQLQAENDNLHDELEKVDGERDAVIKELNGVSSLVDDLAAYEDTGLTPEEVQIQKEAMERMGWFGKMFQRYAGDPRGPIGTFGNALEKFLVESCIEPARNRQVLKDVDGNTWLPMLQDEFRAMADFIERVQGWIPVEERLPKEEKKDD